MDRYEKLRAVSPMEKWSTARHHLGFYNNVGMTAIYTLPDTYTLPLQDYVYKTAEILLDWHPVLSAIPLGEEGMEPQFVRLSEIDFARSITFQQRQQPGPEAEGIRKEGSMSESIEVDPELDELLQKEHNTKFAAPLPFWRLRVLTEADNPRRFTLAFIWHHALCDGVSGMAFHRTFLRALQKSGTMNSGEAKQVVETPHNELLPSIEDLHDLPVSIPYALGLFFKETFHCYRPRGLWTGSRIQVPLINQLSTFTIPQATATAFRAACHRNKTTITATLHAILASAFFDNIPQNYSLLKCGVVLSSRRWMPDIITEDSMGIFVQDFPETFERSNFEDGGFPWDECRRSKQSIDYQLSLRGKNTPYKQLKFVKSYHKKLFLSKIGKSRELSFEVSNLGSFKAAVDNDNLDAPKVGRVTFSQSASVTGPALGLSVASGPDGCMVLSFAWQKGVIDEQLVRSVMAAVKSKLLDITA